jgi:hypothetical protein
LTTTDIVALAAGRTSSLEEMTNEGENDGVFVINISMATYLTQAYVNGSH